MASAQECLAQAGSRLWMECIHIKTFRHLSDTEEPGAGPEADAAIRRLFKEPAAFDTWAMRWRQKLMISSAVGLVPGLR